MNKKCQPSHLDNVNEDILSSDQYLIVARVMTLGYNKTHAIDVHTYVTRYVFHPNLINFVFCAKT